MVYNFMTNDGALNNNDEDFSDKKVFGILLNYLAMAFIPGLYLDLFNTGNWI